MTRSLTKHEARSLAQLPTERGYLRLQKTRDWTKYRTDDPLSGSWNYSYPVGSIDVDQVDRHVLNYKFGRGDFSLGLACY